MVIWNSIKQIWRTPIKTVLFLLLLTLSAVLLSLGCNLWQRSTVNIKAFEDTFTTIGTVQQKASAIKSDYQWNAEKKTNMLYTYPAYNAPIPVSALGFEDVGYIQPPENRPYYGAYHPDYVTRDFMNDSGSYMIIEATPLKDSIPADPIKLKIKRVLLGSIDTDEIWFCDYYNPKPEMMFAGKTYVIGVQINYARQDVVGNAREYVPSVGINSSQFAPDGTRIADDVQMETPWDEVTVGYYETPSGKRWVELIKANEYMQRTIPVTPTNSTNLLMPFYNGDAFIISGQGISEAEYASGAAVCLVSRKFAKRNGLSVGSSLPLPLYFANYRESAGRSFSMGYSFSLINAKGELYPVFADSHYTIVGIYDVSSGNDTTGYRMSENEVVIPSASVKSSDENNIVAYGPMMGYNTSFQIPNGEAERYMEAWNTRGIQDLEIKFYDKGYSKLKKGLESSKKISLVLLASGIITTLLILVFFCHLFISKQKKRTAIERSLGTSKARCTISLLAGILLIVIMGSTLGSMAGFWLTEKTAGQINKETFDTIYSSWT
ncbi:MAG: hypothetical protein K6T85_13235, partial [Gorillibacterium sp.]|nr:hypothetical protein [Gorillibacterium sp.]